MADLSYSMPKSAAAPAPRNPMAQKVARLTTGNQQQEKANSTLLRDLAELREEKSVMVRMFEDQIAESRRKDSERQEEEEVRAAELAALKAPVDEAAAAAEVGQLKEELQRVTLAGKKRLEQKSKEVAQLRADLEQRREQHARLHRAAQAISASADSDLNELAFLRSRKLQLDGEIEDLESEKLKMHCQVDAWGVRLRETHRLAAEDDVKAAAREAEAQASLEGLQASAEKMRKLLSDANEQCEQVKQKSSEVGRPASVKENGTQTRYLSEQIRLREQLEKLTQELEIARQGGGREPPGVLGTLMSFCLRPRFEDPNALPSSQPSTPRALPNSASTGTLSARGRRPLVV